MIKSNDKDTLKYVIDRDKYRLKETIFNNYNKRLNKIEKQKQDFKDRLILKWGEERGLIKFNNSVLLNKLLKREGKILNKIKELKDFVDNFKFRRQ